MGSYDIGMYILFNIESMLIFAFKNKYELGMKMLTEIILNIF